MPLLLAQPDLPFEFAVTSEEGLDHPQVLHNGNSIEIEDPRVGSMRQVGPVAAFAATPSPIGSPAPRPFCHEQMPLPDGNQDLVQGSPSPVDQPDSRAAKGTPG